jgi:hypothetical protein
MGEISSLRVAELHEEAVRARRAASVAGSSTRVGRGTARALRVLADRLDHELEADSIRVA